MVVVVEDELLFTLLTSYMLVVILVFMLPMIIISTLVYNSTHTTTVLLRVPRMVLLRKEMCLLLPLPASGITLQMGKPIMIIIYMAVLLHIIVRVSDANVLNSELSPSFPRYCLIIVC